jgi:hypothetical protein
MNSRAIGSLSLVAAWELIVGVDVEATGRCLGPGWFVDFTLRDLPFLSSLLCSTLKKAVNLSLPLFAKKKIVEKEKCRVEKARKKT